MLPHTVPAALVIENAERRIIQRTLDGFSPGCWQGEAAKTANTKAFDQLKTVA